MSKILVIFALIGAIFWHYEHGGYEAFITAMLSLAELLKSVTFKKISLVFDAFITTTFFVVFALSIGSLFYFYPNFDDLFLKINNVGKIVLCTTLIFIIFKIILLFLRCLLHEISIGKSILLFSYNLFFASSIPILFLGIYAFLKPTIGGRAIDFDYNTITVYFGVMFVISLILKGAGNALIRKKP